MKHVVVSTMYAISMLADHDHVETITACLAGVQVQVEVLDVLEEDWAN